MLKQLLLGVLAAVQLLECDARPPCPLYGPMLPKPTNILQHPAVKAAGAALDTVFPQYIDNLNSTGSQNFSYAVEVFSASETQPIWSHYWTATTLKNSTTAGVRTVTRDAVFRIGSATKIFTVLTFLAAVGDSRWNDPITKYLPDIAAMADKNRGNNVIYHPDWDSITIGSLASQMSGLIRDYALLGEITQDLDKDALQSLGFPPLPASEIPPCGDVPTCDRKQIYDGLAKLPPSFGPFRTAVYSDIGFNLLSYVAESITGRPFDSLVKDHVLTPLNLTHTFVSTPDDKLGIIPGNRYSTSWAFDMKEEWPTGNMYTSPADLSALGRAILSSTLLKPAQTRRWLKPVAFTSDPRETVGMPWGVRQIPLTDGDTYQWTSSFNKAGALGSYSTLFAIMPDLDIGFTIMAAGDVPSGLTMGIADTLANTYIPTMMNMARDQASLTYAGTYRSTNSSLNSTLTVTADWDKPGLGLSTWISNGTDMGIISMIVMAGIAQEYWQKLQPSVRLYPSGLDEVTPDGGKRVAFKAVFEDLSGPNVTNAFSTDCASWVSVTGVVYGSQPLDLFVFNLDATGRVKSVDNAALRVTLDKVDSGA